MDLHLICQPFLDGMNSILTISAEPTALIITHTKRHSILFLFKLLQKNVNFGGII